MTSTNTPDYPEYQFVPSVITSDGQPLATQYISYFQLLSPYAE